jgi:hypothetical protein
VAWAVATGAAIGALVTVSPLFVVAATFAVITVVAAGQSLPDDERRTVTAILAAGILARIAVVAAFAIWSVPVASAQSGGVLLGDEAYMFERSLRARDLLLGFSVGKLDYVMVFEEYANTKYVWWLSWMQITFGPSPYALRLLNGLLFVAAAAILYRLARRGFGPTAAQMGLLALLLLPSLLFGSVSLLKDSIFFFLTVVAFAAAVMIGRGASRREQIFGAALLLAMLWGVSDLRPQAIAITGGGLALGFAMRWTLQRRAVLTAAVVVVVAAAVALAMSDRLSMAVRDALTLLSRQHMGHATAPGHAYRTLDDRFYPDWESALAGLPLQPAEAIRYVGRSTLAFVLVPLPWQATTTSELVYIPEQIVWYLIAVFGLAGVLPAYRRDPLLTSLLLGYMLVIGAAIALTNGNVGTLVRLRGLVMRFAVWIAAVGLVAVIHRFTARKGGA